MSGTTDLAWIQTTFSSLTNIVALTPGGQKFVFGADHAQHGSVVLKLFRDASDPKRIAREIMAAQQLCGCRVPTIYETGVVSYSLGDVPWLIERKLSGSSLRDRLSSTCLNPQELFRLALQLLDTLEAAEKLRIVHRDVKPDNVIVDDSGDFWLIDFGFARHLDLSALTALGLPFGPCTPGYAPPEQFRNRQPEIDGRADLFAVAVTLFESYTRTNPFRDGATNGAQIFASVESNDLPRLQVACKDPNGFADFVSCLSRRRRDQRPRNVQEANEWMKDLARQEGLL